MAIPFAYMTEDGLIVYGKQVFVSNSLMGVLTLIKGSEASVF
nr:hypothetical protein [uncultured Carboxylicivirga sp.]